MIDKPCPKCGGAIKILGLSLDRRYTSALALRARRGEVRLMCRQCGRRFSRPVKLTDEQAMRFRIRGDNWPEPIRRPVRPAIRREY